MRAKWVFRAKRYGERYSWIKRACGERSITRTERDALEFARKALEHLRASSVISVQAWSVDPVEGAPDVPEAMTFLVVPHPIVPGDWVAERKSDGDKCGWHHKWHYAVDYSLFRGSGHLRAVEVRNKAGQLERLVLADQTWSNQKTLPYMTV